MDAFDNYRTPTDAERVAVFVCTINQSSPQLLREMLGVEQFRDDAINYLKRKMMGADFIIGEPHADK
jgi:hypothetical protein